MHNLALFLAQLEPPLIDAFIATMTPVVVVWIVSHIKLKNAQTKQVISDLLTAMLLRGKVFVEKAAVTETGRIGDTGNASVDAVANYAAKMSPQLLKQAGIDVTTPDGQAALAARIVATVPAPAPVVVTPTPVPEEDVTADLNRRSLNAAKGNNP